MTTKLTTSNQIWVLQPEATARQLAADYAERTLPWTFNRLMLNTGANGQKERALNIAKGIVAQEMMRHAFSQQGASFTTQQKSHRDDDLFDFTMTIDGQNVALDIKTVHYYNDYLDGRRNALTPELIISNRSYPGPEWNRFFPMLIPHTQIGQSKEAYCFAIASSADPRNGANIAKNQDECRICAFPYGEHVAFLSSKRLCSERESAEKGFYIRCCYGPKSLFSSPSLTITIVGEWLGNMAYKTIRLNSQKPSDEIGPFSIIDSIKLDYADYQALENGELSITCTRNDFSAPVRNSTGKNINIMPSELLIFQQKDFCNILLPRDYTLMVLGWITKAEFLERCRLYPSWVWPDDKVNAMLNQPWSQITEKDLAHIHKAGFEDCISRQPTRFNAGWMKTSGHGNGACCYVFPNIHKRGGISETNLYVLPQDLHSMETLI